MKWFDLTGKTALVTGAAGGLGQGIAAGLAEAGADVVSASLGSSAETVEKIKAFGRKGAEIIVDLSDHSKLQETFDKALGLTGHIDILVNNAGIIRRTPAKDHSEKTGSTSLTST
ncbi:hypothetical protein HMSSN036_83600 [Paenibacillus macerans]|nr:hypothetical protein HMSSN036_83600 [Paenibacillus macerans]